MDESNIARKAYREARSLSKIRPTGKIFPLSRTVFAFLVTSLMTAMVVGAGFPSASVAQTTFSGIYEFTGNDPCPTTNDDVTVQPAEATFTTVTRVGVGCRPRTDVHASDNWPTAMAMDPTRYISFKVIAQPGFALEFTPTDVIEIDPTRSATGPRLVEAWVSIDGGPFQSRGTAGVGGLFSTTMPAVSGADSVEIRFHAFDADDANGRFRADNIQLAGTTIPDLNRLGIYQFTGNGFCPTTNDDVTTQPANATFSTFTRVGVWCSDSDNDHDSWNWPLGGMDLNRYVYFTVKANGGYTLQFTTGDTFDFEAFENSFGPTTGEVFIGVNGQATQSLGTFGMGGFVSLALPDIAAADSIEIRIHAWGAGFATGELDLDNISLTGLVVSGNATPTVAVAIPDTTIAEDSPPIDNYRDLNDVFDDIEDGSTLTFAVQSNSNPSVLTATVDADSALDLSLPASEGGEATLVIRATDSGGAFVEDTLQVTVYLAGMRMKTGRYTGDGVGGQVVTGLDFTPAVVIVKGEDNKEAVIRTRTMPGSQSKFLTGGDALAPNMVTSLDADGFSIGTDDNVNKIDIEYYWVAFREEPGVMVTGSYVGDGVVGRVIDGVGFQGHVVFVMAANNDEAVHRSPVSSLAFTFNNGSNNNWLTTPMPADGFRVGDDARVNEDGATYHYICWNEVAGLQKFGVYSGDGNLTQDVTNIGFAPSYVMINDLSGGEKMVHRPAAMGALRDSTLYFTSTDAGTDRIKALQSNGFQVGGDNEVNASGDFYSYFAWAENAPPIVISAIPDTTVFEGPSSVNDYRDLNDVFNDFEDGASLSFSIESNSNPGLIFVSIDPDSALDFSVVPSQAGAATIVIRATDSGARFVEDTLVVSVTPTGPTAINALYDFSGTFGCVLTNDSVTAQPLNARFSRFQSVGLQCDGTRIDDFRTYDWPLTPAIDAGKYMFFKLAADGGYSLSFVSTDSLVFDSSVGGSGPPQAEAIVYLDGSPFQSLGIFSTAGRVALGMPAVAAADSVEIRIHAFDAGSASARFTVDNVTLDGTVSPKTTQPFIVAAMPDTLVEQDSPPIDNYRDLNDVFFDVEDGSAMSFTVESNSNPALLNGTIDADSALDISIVPGQIGFATLIVRATDSSAQFVEDTLVVSVAQSGPVVINGLYDFTGTFSCPPENDSVSTQPINAKFSSFLSTGVLCDGGGNNDFRTDDWPLVPAPDAGKYLFFKLAGHNGFFLSLAPDDSLTFDSDILVGGPAEGEVYLHINGGPGQLLGPFVTGTRVALALTQVSAADSVEVRIHAFSAGSSNGRFIIDNVSLDAIVSPGATTPPFVVSAIPDTTVTEDAAPIDDYRDLNTVFGDTEDGNALTFAVASVSDTLLLSATVDADSALDIGLKDDAFGTATIVVRATDSSWLTADDTLIVTVTSVNDTPMVTASIPDVNTIEGAAPIDNHVDLNNVFADPEDGGALTFTIENNSNPALVTATIDADSALDFSIAAGQSGSALVVVRATDTQFLIVEDTLIVTVVPAPPASGFNAIYEFTGNLMCPTTNDDVTIQPAGASFSTFSRFGVTCAGIADVHSSQNWGQAAVMDPNTYVYFTVAANPGFSLEFTTFDSLSFTTMITPNYPASTEAYISVDGQAWQSIGMFPANAPVSLGMPDIAGASSVDFRIFGWDSNNGAGQLRFDNVNLSGTAVPAGSIQMVSGRYTGDGIGNRPIGGVGFEPDLVIIKGDNPEHSIARTSTMIGDASKRLGVQYSIIADRIQALTPDGFVVGTHADINEPGFEFYWTAFKAAPGVMTVDSYIGDGSDDRSITGIGFQPDYVIVMTSANQHAVHRFPSQTGDATFKFDEQVEAPNMIQAFEADGFQIGSDDEVNRTGVTMHYVAFKTTEGSLEGDFYTGTGTAGHQINSLGFSPEYVVVKSEAIRYAAHRSISTTPGTLTFVPGEFPFAGGIEGFLADGFQVGDHFRVNNPFEDYHWVAFRGSGLVDADLLIDVSVSTPTPTEKDTIAYIVKVLNNGPSDATNVFVTDLLPAGVSFVSDSLTQGVYMDASGLWSVGTVLVSSSATLTISAVVDSGTAGSTIDNLATINGADQIDPVNVNNVALASIFVRPPPVSTVITLIDSAGTLVPPLAFENDPALALYIGINSSSDIGVTLDTTSVIRFSDSTETYTARLSNPTYIPGSVANFTVAFQPTPLPAGLIAPAAYDVEMVLSGTTDSATVYADTIVTAGRNRIFIDTPKMALEALPLDVQATLPGTFNAPILAVNFYNGYAGERDLDAFTITSRTTGPGSQAQLDSEIEMLYAYDDVDSSRTLSPPDTVLATSTISAGLATFAIGGRTTVPGFSQRTLIITADVDSFLARDGDELDAAIVDQSDVVFVQSTVIDSSFSPLYPLDSFGRLVVNGMAAFQAPLTPSALDTLDSGTLNNWLFTLVVPQNGYEADTLTALSIKNYAPDFSPDDIAAFKLYRDTGDGMFSVGTDFYLGTLVYSGERIEISGLSVSVDPAVTLFVTADLPVNPTNGSHFRPGLPLGAIDMQSSNDGPVNVEIISGKSFTLRKLEEVAVANLPLQVQAPHPGDVDVPLLLLGIDNNTLQTLELDTLTLSNNSAGAGSITDLDNTLSAVRIYLDDGNGVVDGSDVLLIDNLGFSAGQLTIVDLNLDFAMDELRRLLITADIDSTCSSDGDSLRIELPGAVAIGFDQNFAISGAFPMSTGVPRVIDGMLAHQVMVTPQADSLIISAGNDVLVFDLGVPANGYAADTLQAIDVENLGSATTEHFARLALYQDGGDNTFDAGAGDDVYLGDLVENTTFPDGRHFRMTGMTLPLLSACGDFTRLFLATDIADDYTVGGSIQFSLPEMGLQVASGNDGPIDEPVIDPSLRLIPKPDQLTIFPYSVGDQVVYPGSKRNLNFGVGFYNGYSFSLQLEKIKLHQVETASSVEIDSVFAYADVDTNGLFDPAVDSLISAVASGDVSYTLNGFTLDLPPKKISYVFIAYNLPLAVRDLVTIDFKLFDAEGLTVVPSADVRGEFPINSPGVDVTDGMIAGQIVLTPAPSFQAAPNDQNVLAMVVRVPPNGIWPDKLNTFSIENLGLALPGTDIDVVRLWKEAGGDTNQFDPGDDQLLADLNWNGTSWKNVSPLDQDIPISGLPCYVTFSVAGSPTDGVTFKANIPIDGIQVESGNDGPIDLSIANAFQQSLSTDPIISSIRTDRITYSVGQTISVEIDVRNEGVDTLFAVVPTPLSAGGPGTASLLSGPVPAALDLTPGEDATIALTYSATGAGNIFFCGHVHNQDSTSVSQETCSDAAQIQNRATDVTMDLYNLAPATANRGQENLTLVKLTANHNATDSLSAPALLDGIRIRIEDGNGIPIAPNTILSGITLQVVGGLNHTFSLDDSTTNPLHLGTLAPISILPSDSLHLNINCDIATDAAFTAYRLAVAAPGDIQIIDINDGAATPVSTPDIFPWYTTEILVNERAESLLVSTDPPVAMPANVGQNDVHLFTLSVLNPGDVNTANVVVTGLSISLYDTTGTTLPAEQVIRRLHIRSGQQSLLTTANIPAFDNTIAMSLSTPLVSPPGVTRFIEILADLSDVPQADAFYAVIENAASIAARDINAAQLVAVSALNPTVADFPMFSDRVLFQNPASGLTVAIVDRMPPSVLPSTSAIPVLDLTLDHADTSLSSALVLDSVALHFRDNAGSPIFPGDYFSAMYVVNAGDTISVSTSLSSSDPAAECSFSRAVVVEPGSLEVVSVYLDSKALFAPTNFEVWFDRHHIVVTDGNDGSRLFNLTGSFPFVAGPSELQIPSNTANCGIVSRLPQNVSTTDSDVEAFDLLLENSSPAGHTPVDLRRIRVNLQASTGAGIDPTTLLGAARLLQGDSLVATGQLIANDITFAIPANRVRIPASARDTLAVVVDIDTQSSGLNFRFVLADGAAMDVIDVITGDTLAVGTINNTGYPLKTAVTHVLGSSSAEAFTNYPNPFAAGREPTRITYYIAQTSTVTLKLYTIWGGFVRTLVDNQTLPPGLYQDTVWDGHNGDGDLVSNGAYLLILETQGDDGTRTQLTRKVGVLR